MIQTTITVLGLILAGVGALYFAYIKVMDYWFSDQIVADSTKLTAATTQVADDDSTVQTAAKAAEVAVKAYEDAKSNSDSDINSTPSTSKPS